MRLTSYRVPTILSSDIPDWSEPIALIPSSSFGPALGDKFKLSFIVDHGFFSCASRIVLPSSGLEESYLHSALQIACRIAPLSNRRCETSQNPACALRSTVNFYCFIHKYKLSAPNFVTVQITFFFIIIITKVHGSSRANKSCFFSLVGCVAG